MLAAAAASCDACVVGLLLGSLLSQLQTASRYSIHIHAFFLSAGRSVWKRSMGAGRSMGTGHRGHGAFKGHGCSPVRSAVSSRDNL